MKPADDTCTREKDASAPSDVEITSEARTAPLSDSDRPDANVAPDGHCIMAEDGEMARPDSGDPCISGHADDRAYESAKVLEGNDDENR